MPVPKPNNISNGTDDQGQQKGGYHRINLHELPLGYCGDRELPAQWLMAKSLAEDAREPMKGEGENFLP
jgi:hypothetical protein